MQKARDFGVLNLKRDVFIQQPFYQTTLLEAQGYVWQRRQKNYQGQRWWLTPRQQLHPDTAGLMYIGTHGDWNRAHRGPTQIQARQNPSTEKRRWTQNPSP